MTDNPATTQAMAERRRTYGGLLAKPDFTDLPGMARAVEALPVARFHDVAWIGDDKVAHSIATRRAVVDKDGSRCYGIVGENYRLVNHSEALAPIMAGIRDLGLPIRGSFYQGQNPTAFGGGLVRGVLVFDDPAYSVEIARGERVAMGFKLVNGLDGKTGLTLEAFGLDLVCTNGMMATKILGSASVAQSDGATRGLVGASGRRRGIWADTLSVRQMHVGENVDEALHAFESFVERLLREAAKLPAIMQRSEEVRVERSQVADLLIGAGIPESHADEVQADQPSLLVGPQAVRMGTLRAVYDAGTRWYSGTYDRSMVRAEVGLGQIARILALDDGGVKTLVKEGEERREAIARVAAQRKA